MEKKQKKEYIQIVILSILIAVFIVSIFFSAPISNGFKNILYKADIKVSANDLVVHFINVGQGDAIALRFPNEEVMLIDAGPKPSQNDLVEYIQNSVISSNNYLNIDYLILTHPDTDHSGGMSAIFDEFEIDNFYRPNIATLSEDKNNYAMQFEATEYDETIKRSQIEKGLTTVVVSEKLEFKVGEVEVVIFAPLKIYSTTNSMSLVVKVSYLSKSFLFCGDIQNEAEQDLVLKYGEQLDCDVLKVAHHGSSSSTSQEFVNVVTPEYAVISVGNNSYGHPKLEVIERLQLAGASVYSTKDGSVRFVCGKEMFGVLTTNKTHSFEFIDWWIIALVVIIILVYVLSINIIKVVKTNNQSKIK